MYLQSNENFSASLHSNNAAYLQLAARAEKAAREHGRAEILRAAAEHNAKDQADRRRTAEAAVESVRDLHQRWNADPGSCAHCDDGYGTPLSYPCPTIRSLDPQQQPTTTEAIPMTDRERLLQESALDLRAEIRELRTYAGQAADLIESGRTRDLAQALSLLRSIAHMPPQPTTTEASR
jgi:hypothetical protein